MMDVAIVGGGAIGLLTALRLVDQGATVQIFDQPVLRPPASWAGGGILSPLFPWRYSPALTALTLGARQAYTEVDARLRQQGMPSLEISPCGLLMPSVSDLPQAASWAARYQIELRLADAGQIEPRLNGEGALWMPTVSHIRNPRLVTGLARLLELEGVAIEGQRVLAIEQLADGWAVRTSVGALQARRVLVCAGAWSASLLAPFVSLPVTPVKGEMLLFPASLAAPCCMILRENGYIIPRKDGRMLVGSTVLPGVDDQRPSAVAYRQLEAAAHSLWAPLAGIEPEAHWAGLRPGVDQDHPFLGEAPNHPGLFIATGHYRNGLVCAPASAELMAALMTGDTPAIDPAPYSLSPSSSSPP